MLCDDSYVLVSQFTNSNQVPQLGVSEARSDFVTRIISDDCSGSRVCRKPLPHLHTTLWPHKRCGLRHYHAIYCHVLAPTTPIEESHEMFANNLFKHTSTALRGSCRTSIRPLAHRHAHVHINPSPREAQYGYYDRILSTFLN
jgi:hypothetical protein